MKEKSNERVTTPRTAARAAVSKPTTNPAGKGRTIDDVSASMIYEGCSVGMLAAVFRMDAAKVTRLISDLAPCGTRHGYSIYDLASAAERIVHPVRANNLDEFISKMNHADLPPLVKKDYWLGMRARQTYEIAAGDLWSTDKVIEHISDLFKTISLTARLTVDSVQRETSLTVSQRQIITRHIDELLENTANSITQLAETDINNNSNQEVASVRDLLTAADETEL